MNFLNLVVCLKTLKDFVLTERFKLQLLFVMLGVKYDHFRTIHLTNLIQIM